LNNLGVATINRIGGSDRCATCEQLVANLTAKYDQVGKIILIGVAIGEDNRFPDALTGGTAAGLRGDVVIISSTVDTTFASKVVVTIAQGNKVVVEIYGSHDALPSVVEKI
jgi:putative cell wall-binding protein